MWVFVPAAVSLEVAIPFVLWMKTLRPSRLIILTKIT